MKRLLAPRALATVLHAEPAFFEHAQRVADDPALDIWATADSGWGSQFEPPERDIALQLAARYWRGREGRRVVAVFLRAAAAGMRDSDGTPGAWCSRTWAACAPRCGIRRPIWSKAMNRTGQGSGSSISYGSERA